MYILNRDQKTINKLNQRSFSELGFKEREHLQEWIVNTPSLFGEELLIIQKEFSGFMDTNERLDLLALDKQGDLVIIENKLDDSGRDVTWQALKYTSYCSSLSKEGIRKIYQEYLDRYCNGQTAEDKLVEFFETEEYEELKLNTGLTQRIILVAANFRKEVTSTVLWLLNYKLRIQCFKLIPYSLGDQLFLSVEQIIPTKDAEEFMISMADKAQDDVQSQTHQKQRHIIRKEFWGKLLESMNKQTDLFKNISPSVYHWIGAGSGVRGAGFNFAISKSYARVEIYIDRGNVEENKFIFGELYKYKEEIETKFNGPLVWERLDDKRASRIKSEMESNVFDKENWDEMIAFLTDKMVQIEPILKPLLTKINRKLKTHLSGDNSTHHE